MRIEIPAVDFRPDCDEVTIILNRIEVDNEKEEFKFFVTSYFNDVKVESLTLVAPFEVDVPENLRVETIQIIFWQDDGSFKEATLYYKNKFGQVLYRDSIKPLVPA